MASRHQIEALMGTEPDRAIGIKHSVDEYTVTLHRTKHLAESTTVIVHGRQESHALRVIATLERVLTEAERIGKKAEEAGDLPTALKALREQSATAETFARIAMMAAIAKDKNPPPWGKLSTEEKIKKAYEVIDYFHAWVERLEAEQAMRGRVTQ